MHSPLNNMEDKRYKIEEECTTGWEEIKTNLTKEECQKFYNSLLNDGVSPDRIKITRVQ